MPVFVKIDDYKDVVKSIQELQGKISNAKSLLNQIEQIKQEEETELESWKIGLDDIEQKIANLNDVLTEPKV